VAPLLLPDSRLRFLEDSLFFADLGLDGSFLAEFTAGGRLPGLLTDLHVDGLLAAKPLDGEVFPEAPRLGEILRAES
jgi:hypothetical protein